MNHTKWQTRRETGAQSQGSHEDSPAAEAFERKLLGFGNWVIFLPQPASTSSIALEFFKVAELFI